MANWAYNTLTITGDEAALRAFDETESDELMKRVDACCTRSETEYNDDYRHKARSKSYQLCYSYETRWEANREQIEKLSHYYPTLHFALVTTFIPGDVGRWLNLEFERGEILYRRCPGDSISHETRQPCTGNADNSGKCWVIAGVSWFSCDEHKRRWSLGELNDSENLVEQIDAFNYLGGKGSQDEDGTESGPYYSVNAEDAAWWRRTTERLNWWRERARPGWGIALAHFGLPGTWPSVSEHVCQPDEELPF